MTTEESLTRPMGAGSAGRWGQPTEEELVAILAAVELVWPRPVAPAPAPEPVPAAWRFSGRWWSRPTISRSDRPWIAPSR